MTYFVLKFAISNNGGIINLSVMRILILDLHSSFVPRTTFSMLTIFTEESTQHDAIQRYRVSFNDCDMSRFSINK